MPQWADECREIAEIMYSNADSCGRLGSKVCSVAAGRGCVMIRMSAEVATEVAQRYKAGLFVRQVLCFGLRWTLYLKECG